MQNALTHGSDGNADVPEAFGNVPEMCPKCARNVPDNMSGNASEKASDRSANYSQELLTLSWVIKSFNPFTYIVQITQTDLVVSFACLRLLLV
jgi:hypothetical protein